MRARLGKGGRDAKQEAALEQTIQRLQHKEGKLQSEAGRQAGCSSGSWRQRRRQSLWLWLSRQDWACRAPILITRRASPGLRPLLAPCLPAPSQHLVLHPPSYPSPPLLSAPCAASTQTFLEREALLHRDLSTLISDAQWLKHYGE